MGYVKEKDNLIVVGVWSIIVGNVHEGRIIMVWMK